GRSITAAEQGRHDVESLGAGRRERHDDPAGRPRGDQPASQCDDAQPRLDQQPIAAVQRLAERYQRVIGCQYFEHGRKVAALAERGAEAVRRTFQRNRLGERDSNRRDLEKPHRRLQAPVVISAPDRLRHRHEARQKDAEDLSQRTMSRHFCRTGGYGTSSARRLGHSATLMLAARITLAHFSVSSAMSLAKSAGGPGSTVPPRLASCALSLGSARPALISLLSLSIICDGVFLGAPTPNQVLAS